MHLSPSRFLEKLFFSGVVVVSVVNHFKGGGRVKDVCAFADGLAAVLDVSILFYFIFPFSV